MKIKKKFSYSTKKQIWRLLPTDSGKLVIEERDKETKQVFFNCIDLISSKSIFKNFQLKEKYWIGIESIHDDIIFFHKFVKPDMPQHSGIIAYSIEHSKVLWQTDMYNFLFIYENVLYTFRQNFEGRTYYQLNYKTGVTRDEINIVDSDIKKVRDFFSNSSDPGNYLFPLIYEEGNIDNKEIKDTVQKLKEDQLITGKLMYTLVDNLLLLNFHIVEENNYLKNIFKTVDLNTGKIILEEILDEKTKLFIPDSFFIKDKFLFLLFGRNKVKVYSID